MKKYALFFAGVALAFGASCESDKSEQVFVPEENATFRFEIGGLDELDLAVGVVPDNDKAGYVWCGLAHADELTDQAAVDAFAAERVATLNMAEALRFGPQTFAVGREFDYATQYYAVVAVMAGNGASILSSHSSARFTTPVQPAVDISFTQIDKDGVKVRLEANNARIRKIRYLAPLAASEERTAEQIAADGVETALPAELEFDGLEAETAYAIHAVGFDASGALLTPACRGEFTTRSKPLPQIEDATALYYGKANCILLPAGGSVTFDAAPYYTTNELYTYENLSHPSLRRFTTAQLLWSDVSSKHIKVAFDADAQTVTVSNTNEIAGNSIVALYDADAQMILWTFHIWVGGDQAAEIVHASRDGSRYRLLDRNLGATEAVRSDDGETFDPVLAFGTYGLYYQWGRKDPFVGADSFGSAGNRADIYPSTAKQNLVQRSAETGTVAYTLQHPMDFIFGEEDWIVERNDRLWGNEGYVRSDVKVEPTTPGETAEKFALYLNRNKGVRSVYDPCPEGYHVAPMDAWGYCTDTGTFDVGSGMNVADIMFTSAGLDFYPSDDRQASTFYAFGGYLYSMSGDVSNNDHFGFVWSNSPAEEEATYAHMFYFGTSYGIPVSKNHRALGCSVRCCRIE